MVKPVFDPKGHLSMNMSPQEYSAYHRRKYQEWWRATHTNPNTKENAKVAVQSNGEVPVKKIKPREEVVPVGLKECPHCGARFYMAKGSDEEAS